ncbi:hypothetical protein [Tabrizicola sp.]|uniref:hypothetical protein n=1 Tax=Tabrizicola sp. TaxID=2005166 RepID=UPI001A57ECF3|nr:hypothetical protein [Tabrizicola sp.]MBL9075511.1 hypothetical protein [Tabrizicola sp.]
MTAGLKIEQGRIAGGVWEAVATGSGAAPVIEALHAGRAVEGVEVRPVTGKAGRFAVRVPIPDWALNEGVQTILVQSGGETLAQVTLVAGQVLDEDIRAELSLLRAELDLLKRAFQRHAREG